LLLQGLDTQPFRLASGGPLTTILSTAGSDGPSVLARLSETVGPVPRVLLRDSDLATGPGPVVKPFSAEMPVTADPAGRLQVFGEITRGGMGAVLKGRDGDIGRDLAIKVLLEQHRDQPELIRRFIEEAQIAGQLQHPGVVPVYELGAFRDRRPFFTMKLVKGRTLADVLAARTDPTADQPRVLGIVLQVCQTIAYAHARGVVHRDLKPSNVMVGNFGEVQVLDWGLAKVLPRGGVTDDAAADTPSDHETVIATSRAGSDSDLSCAGSVLGTPAYMAPEQARGETEHVDERADVFALGSILCEVLTGKPAFLGRSSGESQRKAARGELADTWARLLACEADAELVALTRACLAPEREDRPRDAGGVVSRLSSYLAGVQERLRAAELSRAAESARAEEAQRTAAAAEGQAKAERRARRMTSALAASILALVGLGGGGLAWFQGRHARQLADEHQRTLNALGESRDSQRRAEAAERLALRQTATALLDRALSLCQQGEERRGLLWLVRSLELASRAGADDIADACRWNLGAWSAGVHELTLALDHPGPVHAVALSPDGELLAAAGPEGNVRLWRTATGAAQGGPLAHPAGVQALAFLPDGHTLLSGCADGAARLWDCRSGTPIGRPLSHYRAADRPAEEWPFRDGVSSVAVSPDGATAVTGGCDGTVRLWSMPDGRPLASASDATGPVLAVAMSPDGSTVISGGHDWKIRRWDARSLRSLGPPIDVGSLVWGLAFTPDSRTTLIGAWQKTALLRVDLATGTQAPPLKHQSPVVAVACSPDGQVLVSGGIDKVARVWDAAKGRPFGPALPSLGAVLSVAISRDGRFVAAGSEEGAVRLWRLAPGHLRHTLSHPPRINSLAFSPDGRHLLAGNAGNSDAKGSEVARWDVATGRRVEPTLRHAKGQGWVGGIAVSPDGAVVYTADGQGQVVHRWEAATGKELGVAGPHGDEIWSLALSPDGRRLLTGSAGYKKAPEGCSARLWDATTGTPIGAPMAHGSGILGLAISPDGRTVLTASSDLTTRLWDAATAQPLGPPRRHDAEVKAVAFHPDGTSVLTGFADRNAQRWELATWRPLGPPLPHEGEVTSVGFTRDSSLIVTASSDGTARLWHPETGKQVGPSLVHGAYVAMAVCGPDGTALATCSDDGNARLWALPARARDALAMVKQQVDLRTGMSLDDNGTMRVLSPSAWQAVRSGEPAPTDSQNR
jgi:WD40 repeat protein/tRNA A-37 threonylcarbamoyl transferase component Bud32